MRRLGRRRVLAAALAAASLVGAGSVLAVTRAGGDEATAVREVLAQGKPAKARGQTLGLSRVTVPPGVALPAHTHPGMQLASIESGTLTYRVLEGRVRVRRAPAPDGTPGPIHTIRSGGVVELRPGDWIVETRRLVHASENRGAEPVVILLATLFDTGAPPSSPARP